MVTNENGYIDSVTDKIYSKVNTTNGTVKVDASSVVTRNSRGMFPRDTYLITELNTPAGYMPIQPMTVVLDKQSYKYQWILEDKDIISALRVEKRMQKPDKSSRSQIHHSICMMHRENKSRWLQAVILPHSI